MNILIHTFHSSFYSIFKYQTYIIALDSASVRGGGGGGGITDDDPEALYP